MPAPKIQCDYDGMSNVANTFAKEADQTRQLIQSVGSCVGRLQDGGWIGVGAEAFFQEMEQLVNPGMERLANSLQDAGSASKKIADALKQAEDECGGLFS